MDEAALRSDADPSSLKGVNMDAAMQYADQGAKVADTYSEKHTDNETAPVKAQKEAPKTTSASSNTFYAQILAKELEKDPNAATRLSQPLV